MKVFNETNTLSLDSYIVFTLALVIAHVQWTDCAVLGGDVLYYGAKEHLVHPDPGSLLGPSNLPTSRLSYWCLPSCLV